MAAKNRKLQRKSTFSEKPTLENPEYTSFLTTDSLTLIREGDRTAQTYSKMREGWENVAEIRRDDEEALCMNNDEFCRYYMTQRNGIFGGIK